MATLSEICCCFSDIRKRTSEKCRQISDMETPDLKTQIVQRIAKAKPRAVWTPIDFLDLGTRNAVDKVLQRLILSADAETRTGLFIATAQRIPTAARGDRVRQGVIAREPRAYSAE